MTAIYRAQPIGSLLRAEYLRKARQARRALEISAAEFKRIEDRAVNEAVALQEAAGLDIITDGEVRRLSFVGPLLDMLEGFSQVSGSSKPWHKDDREVQLPWRIALTGKLRRRRSLVAEEFAYARGKASKPLKVTLPSPLMLSMFWSPQYSPAAYPDPFAAFADGARILREDVRELAELGCEYIQIDAPELATLVDDTARAAVYDSAGISSSRMLNEGIEIIDSLADAPGVTFGIHLCRGNNEGHWLSKGGYEAISKQVFKRATRFRVLLLEYDDWRSGSFEALADVPRDKTVVLGLISTKTNELEPAGAVMARVEQASRYFPREQLALSTQCGFNSGVRGNPIDLAMQDKKLRLVSEVAHRLWN